MERTPSNFGNFIRLSLAIGLVAGCGSPPPDGYERYWHGDVSWNFHWDDGTFTSFEDEDVLVVLLPDEEDMGYLLQPGGLTFLKCEPLHPPFGAPGPVADDGLVILEMEENVSCSWRTDVGTTIDIELDHGGVYWGRRELWYTLTGRVTRGGGSSAAEGDVVVGFEAALD